MNILSIQDTETNEMKLQSKDQESSFKSDVDQSKQTYTAIIFNDNITSNLKQLPEKNEKQPNKPRQSFQGQLNNRCIEDFLKVNSITKMMSSDKNGRNSANLFVNAKVNNSIEKPVLKASQRPVSAFIRNQQAAQSQYKGQKIKECYFLGNKEILLSGKNCFEDSNWKFDQKETYSTCNKLEQKMVETPNMFGYIAKSRLLSNKQAKKSVHNINKDFNINKKQPQSESSVNFQALHKNLLFNKRSHKSSDKHRTKNHLQRQKKASLHKSLKLKQNIPEKKDKETSNTLIIMRNQANSFNPQSFQTQETTKQAKCSQFSNSFHRHNSKIPLTTEVLKSMKKGKQTISKIMQMNKQLIIEPKLLIQNVEIPKKAMVSTSNTSSNISHMGSQKNIAKYLAKMSYSLSKQKKARQRDTECRLTVQCKKVTYF